MFPISLIGCKHPICQVRTFCFFFPGYYIQELSKILPLTILPIPAKIIRNIKNKARTPEPRCIFLHPLLYILKHGQ